MKKQLLIIITVMSSAFTFAQNEEFTTHDNGLIYSKLTMNKLATIVDSLNLKYKYCDLDKIYYAKSQTIGHYIHLYKGDIKSAKKDMEKQLDIESFLKKYPQATVEKDMLIVRYQYKNYKEQDVVEFTEIDVMDGSGYEIQKTTNLEQYRSIKAGSWVHKYNKKDSYSNEYISAFYFPTTFTSEPLVEKYARMVGYSNCLIDTTTTKFKKNAEQEFYTGLPKNWQQLSKKEKAQLLVKMRGTKIMGTCSMDSRPREHAANIALLAAETVNWEIFLRSHLDIMNDRFDRASDGSYAQAGRKTYIRELEALNINVPDLIFGISIRLENAAKNHYYGKINRIGRALAESKNRAEIENTMSAMIKDTQLDDFNRILIYYLYRNYIHYLEDETLKTSNTIKLKNAVTMLPEYLNTKIKIKE